MQSWPGAWTETDLQQATIQAISNDNLNLENKVSMLLSTLHRRSKKQWLTQQTFLQLSAGSQQVT